MEKSNYVTDITFILLIVRSILGLFVQETLVLTIIFNLFLAISLLQNGVSIKIFLLLLTSTCLILYNKQMLGLVDVLLTAYVIRNQNIGKLIKISLKWYGIVGLILVILNFFGWLHSEYYINYKGDEDVYANMLGTKNPNVAGMFYYSICALLVLNFYDISSNSKRIYISILLCLLSFHIYNLTFCRTSLYSSYLLSLMFALHPIIIKFRLVNKFVFSFSPVVISILSIWVILHPTQYAYIDEILTNRVAFPAFAIGQMTFLNWLFGLRLENISLENFTIDSSYISILLAGGVITFIFIFYLFSKNIKEKYESVVMFEPVIISILVYGITENIFSSATPLSALFYSIILFKKY